jgi:indolepyruvate ferredoxin oxidoreductase beta subunit
MTGGAKRNHADGGRFKLLIVGVGGQGVLTAARFLGEAAFHAGLEAVVGQLHGLSQRGGSVRCTVLIGPGQSSFIERSAAQVVLGLEPLEVLRARPEMSERTKVIVNLGPMIAHTFTQSGLEYPDVAGILAGIRSVAPDVLEVDGPALVESIGVPRVLNIAMLGVVAGLGILPLDGEALWASIERLCPERYLEPNRRAFELGMEAART